MDTQLHPRERTALQMPRSPVPSRTAPDFARALWSEDYVAWYIQQTPQDDPMPDGISPTHRYEVEFDYCMLDPQRYWRETQEELRRPRFDLIQ